MKKQFKKTRVNIMIYLIFSHHQTYTYIYNCCIFSIIIAIYKYLCIYTYPYSEYVNAGCILDVMFLI